MATILKPDATTNLGGVTVNEYLLTKHNPNKIDMPTAKLTNIIGVTVHNTDWITVASGTTPAEQYTRATVNGNMKSVRVHYYVDDTCAWQNLPLDLAGWHAADGSGDGNRKTIAIECIMSKAYNADDKKSEDNCAKLAAALLKKYGLGVDHLYTHTHWLNVKDGKKGTTDQLNVMKNSYKMCPAYILPHWDAFKSKVASYLTPAATPAKTNPYPLPTGTVKKGDNGDSVKWLQWELAESGYLRSGEIDGGFGKITLGALLAFQFEAGLTVDGSCGPKTRDALRKAK